MITIYTHPDFEKHEMGSGHPECPERIIAITTALKKAAFHEQLNWVTPPQASGSHLVRVHDQHYINKLFLQSPKEGYFNLDPDTRMNPATLSAALYAAGAVTAAVDDIFNGKQIRAFCCVRPPGHHAESNKAMGFCFFNNIAVGVAHALSQYDCQRIAIVDFDVHHGNGTQAMFLREPKVCFWSSFQHPFYPGTSLKFIPKHIHLCPLAAGSGSEDFQKIVTENLIPTLEDFKPELIFISAGFDAHYLDPLASLQLHEKDYAFITQQIGKIADKYAKGRIISTLEGGYHLKAIATSAVAHVEALLNQKA